MLYEALSLHMFHAKIVPLRDGLPAIAEAAAVDR
jgi:hypothetical protein